MKKTKKLWAFLLAMVMMLALGMTAMAAGTGTITITPPAGTDANARNTYNIYKVFDAVGDGTNISYKLVSEKTTAPAGFTVDAAGNVKLTRTTGDLTQLTADEIAAIAAYVTEDDVVATPTAKGTANAVAEGLPNGYYYITTSTGTVVTIDSTNPNAKVIDKNTVPAVDKKITNATEIYDEGKKAFEEIGKNVGYTATITVGKGAKGYVFHDIMGTGLSYNNDVQVFIGEDEVLNTDTVKYTVTKEGNDTFTIKFEDSYIQTLSVGAEIKITYSATVTGDAITDKGNDAYVSYGDTNSNNKTPLSETDVYNKEVRVEKVDAEGNALANAGFSLKKLDGENYLYYKYDTVANEVEWVSSLEAADKYMSVEGTGYTPYFKGLVPGTYYLEETVVPNGYNKAADVEVVLNDSTSSSDIWKTIEIENNKGAVLPSTGGIGTTMFYVIGGALVLVAVVLLVTRKRMSVEK